MPSFRVIKPGLQTTVQDAGRWGWQTSGVSVSGAMDQPSYRAGNALVGNDPTAASLEATLIGPRLEFEDARRVAVTGAHFELTVNGTAVPMGEVIQVAAGAQVIFGARLKGARAYLAVEGGIDTAPVLGSRATHLASRLGGLNGRALVAEDRVPIGRPHTAEARAVLSARRRWESDDIDLAQPIVVRVIPDRREDRFATGALQALQSAPYTVTPVSDRMGFRLAGPLLEHSAGPDMLSEITPIGTLQVPGSGQPIVLMADRQTTGGYAPLAYVIGADIARVAQLAPGDQLSFSICSAAEARGAWLRHARTLSELEAQVPR